jgi:hypothetical protein
MQVARFAGRKTTEDPHGALERCLDLMSSLHHPNLLRPYEAFEDGNEVFVVYSEDVHQSLSTFSERYQKRSGLLPEQVSFNFPVFHAAVLHLTVCCIDFVEVDRSDCWRTFYSS